ncbi:gephyrin-like molybdotransferase Glp [Thalassoglobus sp.]|uniref:molybdopterin molybdotransferase MoeA n=1 Tax=Thalassoglobus sp. TaxID=2795869 RepID=UPI003AA821BA
MSPQDIRMSGFESRSTVDEALAWIDRAVQEIPEQVEEVSLELSHGRTLAERVVSQIDVPGFDRSAMDGYAVIADETTGASDYNPIRLQVVGDSMPGNGYSGEIRSGQAVRTMTGAPIPSGATAVVPAEYTEAVGDNVLVSLTVGQFKHIGRTGEDIRIGATVVDAGRILRPQDVAVIASIGQAKVSVRKQPLVRVIITGNELVRPGEQKRPHQIYEANSSLLSGTIPRDGGILESVRFIEDSESAIRNALLEPGADVILVSGGSSVGAEDFAPGLVAQLGELPIHGVAMRPSSPTGLGRISNAMVVLLPGNPVSCLCAYDFFAGRAIRQLAGRSKSWPFRTIVLPLGRKIASAIGRTDYCRVRVEAGKAIPLAISGASILSSTTRADGFVIVPADSEGLPAETPVTVLLYSELFMAN